VPGPDRGGPGKKNTKNTKKNKNRVSWGGPRPRKTPPRPEGTVIFQGASVSDPRGRAGSPNRDYGETRPSKKTGVAVVSTGKNKPTRKAPSTLGLFSALSDVDGKQKKNKHKNQTESQGVGKQ